MPTVHRSRKFYQKSSDPANAGKLLRGDGTWVTQPLNYTGGIAGASVPATATTKGDYYVVNTAGTSQGKTWGLGDIAIYSGTSGTWDQIPLGAWPVAVVSDVLAGTDNIKAITSSALLSTTVTQNGFRSLALQAIKSARRTGKKISNLHFGDSEINGAAGGTYRDTFDKAWQRAFGRGGQGFMPFEYNQLSTCLCGPSATSISQSPLWNPTTAGWSVVTQSDLATWTGNKLYSFSGTMTYKVGASGQVFYIGNPDQPFTQATLFYLEHTGAGQLSFGKDGDLLSVNCGGAATTTVKTIKRRIWNNTPEDSTLLARADSGDVYLLGILMETDLPNAGICHVGGVGGITAAACASLDQTAFETYIRELAPTTVTINLGTNDRGTATSSQLQGYLTTIITRIRNQLPTVPILIQIPNLDNSINAYAGAWAALDAITDVELFYWRTVIGNSLDGVYIGPDNIHPTARGCALIGGALIEYYIGTGDMMPSIEWPYPDPDSLTSMVIDEARNGVFTAAATDWAGTGGGTVTVDTVNKAIAIASGASAFGGALLSTGSNLGGSLLVGELYCVEVTVSAISGGTWLLYEQGNVTKNSPYLNGGAAFTGFTLTGVQRWVFSPTANITALRLLCSTAGNTLTLSKFKVTRITDATSRFRVNADKVRSWFPGKDYTGNQNIIGTIRAQKFDPYYSSTDYTRRGSLSEKLIPTTATATTFKIYDIGIIQGYPNGVLEIEVTLERYGTTARIVKRAYIAVDNTTVANKVTGAALMSQATVAKVLAGDAIDIDAVFSIALNGTTGRLDVFITLTMASSSGQYVGLATGKYTFPWISVTGPSLTEN